MVNNKPNIQLKQIERAKHELLFERDEVRQQIMAEISQFIEK